MGKPVDPPSGDGVESIDLREALEERYLAYALSTIMHRALPDARDGLKPVHRRIMHAMRLLRLDPGTAFKKCARIVGDVIGKYHPHGDQAVYDALVRLAQDFAQRYPLVDGQGNFGNIDGDNAAAYRYTEARLTEVARLLLEGIDEDAVDFRDTYNGEDDEPVVLPAAFPNLLANGSQGIAVGMATSIPPHNAAELCDAALYLISHPKATSEQLLTFVPGPDFPTGGVLVEPRASMVETYRTGRGSFRLRARWEKEETGRGTWVVVITEIPYLVPKGRLIEKLAELINEKKLPLVGDVRDESAEDVRVVIEPRARTVDPALMMESLFRLSELESRISMNMNVLSGGVIPRVLGLAEALREWLDHRRTVLLRRSRHRLNHIEKRLEILQGMLIVYLDLDRVIKIIREEDEPKVELMRYFELTDNQAEAILNTRLRSLRKLEEMELKRELTSLQAEKGQIETLLGSEAAQWKTLSWEIREVRKTFGPETKIGKRRTSLADAPDLSDIDFAEAMVEARAYHGRGDPEGLDPRPQGPRAGPLQSAVQGRRRLADVVLLRHRGQDPGAGRQRQGVHPRGLAPAGRARLRRSHSPAGRYRSGRGDRAGLAAQAGREAAVLHQRGPRLRGGLRRRRGQHQEGQERPDGGRGPQGPVRRPGRWRPHGHHRREPQAAGVPAGADARDVARQGRSPAALQGRRRLGRQGVQPRRRPHLA